METIEEIFLKYGSHLEDEQIVRQNIAHETKSLEKINNSMFVLIERLHHEVTDASIQNTCCAIKHELDKAKYAFHNLQQVLPADQFYRYNGLFKVPTQQLVMATALMVYLSEERLVNFEEAASILGLQVFSSKNVEEKELHASVDKDHSTADKTKSNTLTNELDACEFGQLPDVAEKSSNQDAKAQVPKAKKGPEIILAPPEIILARVQSNELDSDGVTESTSTASSFSNFSDKKIEISDNKPDLTTTKSSRNEFIDRINHIDALYLDLEDFLIGTLKIGSELARLSVNAVSCENFVLPFRVNKFLRELHAGYTLLQLRNSYLRKTYDELKYSLKKTEDIVYNLSVRGLKPLTFNK
ncbi:uncharacterized protein LOC108666347 [Hyalella azteca]|uniref:Translin n=1 Tax=Hyalella azteca TaxID=294128 RepID=A0A8B7N5V6_HYAAZ|nr:uncharacterized protein LOC108666347 [Hyalella azteca]XP_047736426.1 uncharacterized protein LOC108666347 [Hyalella azteca]